MIACYLELYEEGEVEHINGPTHPPKPKGTNIGSLSKVEYTVACTVFMGGRCVCALAHVYFKNNLFNARPRAVELRN